MQKSSRFLNHKHILLALSIIIVTLIVDILAKYNSFRSCISQHMFEWVKVIFRVARNQKLFQHDTMSNDILRTWGVAISIMSTVLTYIRDKASAQLNRNLYSDRGCNKIL